MKKSLIIVFILTLLLTTLTAFSKEKYDRYTLDCINNLDKYRVVDTPFERWTNVDFIKRRDVLDLIFFIRFQFRDYDLVGGGNDDESNFNYVDIKLGTDDEFFVHALSITGILEGRNISGSLYAYLDEDTTYYEALVLLGRLFTNHNRSNITDEILGNYQIYYPYFYYLQDLKIINNTSPVDLWCPQLSIEELDDKIPAYEFLSILNRALYVPTNPEGGYDPSLSCYYINDFIYNYEQELKWQIRDLEEEIARIRGTLE